MLELTGVAVPEGVDGTSLRQALEGGAGPARDSLFTVYMKTQRAVRDQRWKLIAYPSLGYLQLFDLQADPFEMHNLADRQDHAAEVSRLRALMRTWQVRVGDPVAIPTTSTTPPGIDITGMARETDQWQPEWIVKKYFQR